MRSVFASWLLTLQTSFRARSALQLEILALRHQLQVLERSQRQRLRLTRADRLLWVWLSRVWDGWRAAVVIVKPETVLAWHRQGFKLFWTWQSRRRFGRPVIAPDIRTLIRTMAEANPRWGAPRIHGELLKLGINVSQATVAKYMIRHRRPPSQAWRTFLANHVDQIVAADFFVVPTATYRRLFVLVIRAGPTDIWHFPARVVVTPTDAPILLQELSGFRERPMIIRMTTASHPQQRYDHRLRDLVQRTGDLTIVTDLGVPRSTARGWLRATPTIVVSLEVADLTEQELRQEILKLRRRVEKLAALLRLALALLRTSGFKLSGERLPDGHAKLRILRAVDRAHACIPLRAILRFLRVSPSRFQAWRRRQAACALDDQSCCPRTSPHRLTLSEVQVIGRMVTSPEYRHVPTGTLAVLAQRLGMVCASPSTWYRLVRKYGWRRPRLRVHPAKPKVGIRTTRADEMWHIDTTVIRLLDGTRAYLHAVIDNFSRRILAWRVADTFAPVNSVAVLLEASQGATSSATTPVVLADAGVENVNAQVDALVTTGVLRRVLAFTELKFSNSMIEAWWRSLKHQWLFLHPLDNVATIRRLVAFYVGEHNSVLPHSAFLGQTPDEMYFGSGDGVPTDLTSRAAAARRARVEANRSASCETCPSLNAAA